MERLLLLVLVVLLFVIVAVCCYCLMDGWNKKASEGNSLHFQSWILSLELHVKAINIYAQLEILVLSLELHIN